MKNLKKNGGFTLVELIVVIAILAILAAVAVPAYSGYIEKANEAGDQTLLATINRAFASACLENGFSQYDVDSARINVNADGTVGTENYTMAEDAASATTYFSSVIVDGENKASAMNASFAVYYSGNESAAFKVYNLLNYNPATGTFTGYEISAAYYDAYNSIIQAMGTQIGTAQNSAFATIGSSALAGQVTGVTSLATEMLFAEDSTLAGIVFDEEGNYMSGLANTLGISVDDLDKMMTEMGDEKAAQFLANSTVLTVAQTMNDSTKVDREAFANMLKNAEFGQIGTSIQTSAGDVGLAQAAMLYGMYTAYAPEEAAKINDLKSVDSLVALKDDEGFTAYLSQIGTEGSQAQKDLDGYLAAMDIVNNAVSDSPDVAMQVMTNGYTDPELVALLQQVLGK